MTPRPPTPGELRLYRVCRLIAVGLSRVFFPGHVVGRENIPQSGPFILAPVHRSYLDWLLVARVTDRRMRYIAKQEIWKSHLVGRLVEALGAFPVNRSGADREALDRCRQVLVGGEPLVMFPEGTRRSGPVVEGLREGVAYLALRSQVPVVPVGIGGSEKAMPRGSALPKPHRINLVVGPPLQPPAVPAAQPAAPPTSTGADGDGSGGGATTRARTRVSRRAMKEFSDQLGAAIQQVYDEAERMQLRGPAH
jgi:1-acyl-sn-glycerol-3-phosphate acyltransferase